jgi:hypothetical protein
MTDQDFANIFAMAQSIPGPNMILMMSFVGWKVWGFPGAVASAFATFGPPCTIYFASYRLWDRFRDEPWQQIVRLGWFRSLWGGSLGTGDGARSGHQLAAVVVTIAAAAITLATRFGSPMCCSWVPLSAARLL